MLENDELASLLREIRDKLNLCKVALYIIAALLFYFAYRLF